MKLTRKQIDIIIQHTPQELKGKKISSFSGDKLGSHVPSCANWAYIAQYIDNNGTPVLVVTRFGEIM